MDEPTSAGANYGHSAFFDFSIQPTEGHAKAIGRLGDSYECGRFSSHEGSLELRSANVYGLFVSVAQIHGMLRPFARLNPLRSASTAVRQRLNRT